MYKMGVVRPGEMNCLILQSVVLSGDCCPEEALYFRRRGEIALTEEGARLAPGSVLSADTYMNAFDAAAWRRACGELPWRLELEVRGACRAELICRRADGTLSVCARETSGKEPVALSLVPEAPAAGLCWLRLSGEGETVLRRAAFVTDMPPRNPETTLGLAICTYRREARLRENLRRLAGTRFFDEGDPLYGRLRVHVADNASILPLRVEQPFVRLFHNPNEGGSGGYARPCGSSPPGGRPTASAR